MKSLQCPSSIQPGPPPPPPRPSTIPRPPFGLPCICASIHSPHTHAYTSRTASSRSRTRVVAWPCPEEDPAGSPCCCWYVQPHHAAVWWPWASPVPPSLPPSRLAIATTPYCVCRLSYSDGAVFYPPFLLSSLPSLPHSHPHPRPLQFNSHRPPPPPPSVPVPLSSLPPPRPFDALS